MTYCIECSRQEIALEWSLFKIPILVLVEKKEHNGRRLLCKFEQDCFQNPSGDFCQQRFLMED